MPELTAEQRQIVETTGYGLAGNIGGLPKRTYYTPDGRVIRAVESIREYVRKDKDGKVIEQGKRDANLDKGWLLQRPAVLKPHCQTCNRWHDTLEQVAECKAKQEAFVGRALKDETEIEAKRKQAEADRVSSLESKIERLTALVEKLTGGASGEVLQRGSATQGVQVAGGNGTAEEGVQ